MPTQTASRRDDAAQSLPDNQDVERLILGAVMVAESAFIQVAATLTADDFSLEKHRRIFLRMQDLQDRGDSIDRVTVANELKRHGQLESVDGLSYLVSLDDGLPTLHNLENYIAIIREKSRLRQIITLARHTESRCMMQEESSNDILGTASENMLRIGSSDGSASLMSPGQIVAAYEGGINAFLDFGHRKPGIQTGFTKLDEMTGGFREGELIILAARPGMGKSSLAMSIAQNIVLHPKNPKAVAIFSLEMSRESLLTRMVCAVARVDQHRFRSGYLNETERRSLSDAFAVLADSGLLIDDAASANLMDIHTKVRKLKAERDVGLVVVDYLQLMQGRGKFENRVQEIGTLSRGFKIMSKELGLPFLVLSQLSRAPETRPGDHRPMLSDLRESGSIEADADMVAFIFREELYRPDKESLKGLAEVILAKQRNGPTGRIKLAWLSKYTRFENMSGDFDDANDE